MDDLSHISQGGPHVVCGLLSDGRFCAVAVLRAGGHIAVITAGTGTTPASAIADCRNDIDAAMKSFLAEHRDDPDFRLRYPTIFGYSGK